MWTASWLALVAIVAAGAYQHHADTAMALAGGGQTWIDDAVPPGEPVAVLGTSARRPRLRIPTTSR